MLLSYTAHVTKEKNRYTAIVYTLPVKYSLDSRNMTHEEALEQVLSGVANEMDAYLRNLIKRKFQFPLPYHQPPIMDDYDIPVQLDLAFVIILKVFRSSVSQKELAKQLGKSPAYISSIETMETGVTLANANEMLMKLGIRTSMAVIPYRANEHFRYQFSPDKGHIPIISVTSADNPAIDLDVYQYASYTQSVKKRALTPFPASIKHYASGYYNEKVFEVTFPALEKYGLDICATDTTEEQAIARAANSLNLALLSSDKKIDYPKIRPNDPVVYLWADTVNKHFQKI